jgi:hypothetical protein
VITNTPPMRRGTAALALALAAIFGLAPISAPAQQPTQEKPAEQPKSAEQQKTGQPPAEGAPAAGTTQSEMDAKVIERLSKLKGRKASDWTAEELAEFVTLNYGGRRQLSTVYNTGREEGRITLKTGDGELQGDYVRRFATGPMMAKDRVRLDLILETSPKPEDQLRYTITYNGATVWGAQNNQYVQPEPGSSAAFKASVLNDYSALFRYHEEGATLIRGGTKKVVGLETELLEMTRADGSKVRFYISPKSYRILHVEYDIPLATGQAPVTFRESYFDWKAFQGVIVPGVRKLRQSDQLVQTLTINGAVYGVAHEDTVFLQV